MRIYNCIHCGKVILPWERHALRVVAAIPTPKPLELRWHTPRCPGAPAA